MATHLMENQTWGAIQESSAWASAGTQGNRFTVAASVDVNALRWYRNATGSNRTPAALDLWKVDGTHLAHLTTITDSGAVGWQVTSLTAPVTLNPGIIYIVSRDINANDVWGYLDYADLATPPFPFAFDSTQGCYHFPGTGFPDALGTGGNAHSFPVDVEVGGSTTGGGGGGATGGDIAAWESSDTAINLHKTDGIPWQTYALQTGSSGFVAIKGIVDSILTSVGSGLGSVAAGINTTVNTINTGMTTMLSRWSAALATALQDMSDNFAAFLSGRVAQDAGTLGGSSFPAGTGTLLWTKTAEVDFTFQISWDEPADLYTLSLTSIPSRINTVDVDGATWRPRVGWWALRNGDLLGVRAFLSWENEYMEDQGRRMPGIVIRTQPGIAGHLEAWTLA